MWTPANISTTCQLYPSLSTCQPPALAFMVFLMQNFGYSYDNHFSDEQHKDVDGEEYDFIIAGGGAAGCVVANRLSEISQWKVLLLEAGDEEPIIADVPGFFTLLLGSSLDWNYQTEPEPYACYDIKTCFYSRGKVLGGSSSINFMMYVRGSPKDYDYWASLGNSGWSYQDVLPYFLKSEDSKLYSDSEFHSTGGYLTIDRFPFQNKNESIIINAWKELGLSEVDYNGRKQIGISELQYANINGARLSMNGAFIRPIRGRRPNLTIRTNSKVTKIIIDKSTKRAVGVEYNHSDDKSNIKKVYAKKEVIVSAGTFESPKLLMLSGIGHADVLKKSNIEVIQNSPVGDNLQDHVFVQATTGIYSDKMTSNIDFSQIRNDAVYWLNTHNGPLSELTVSTTMIYDHVLEQENSDNPNVQIYHFYNILESIDATENGNYIPNYIPGAYGNAFTIAYFLLNPKSRGTVRLNASNPIWSQPIIKFNYLTHSRDREILAASCLKTTRNLFKTKSFEKNKVKKYTKPFKSCKNFRFESKEYFDCVVEKYSRPGLHAVGTCKMGPEHDRGAVVSPNLKVHGIDGLRVIDASVMPSVPSGNTFAPTVMVAEKGSDLIKEYWLNK